MTDRELRQWVARIDPARLGADLHWLAADPLPHRKLNASRPGQSLSTLQEADAWLTAQLEGLGCRVLREEVPVQAFRCDRSKPKAQWYSAPRPDDPWYTAANLQVDLPGARPDRIVLALAHKDSQSWVDSPGAADNAVGTASVLELARVLSDGGLPCTVRLLWCNEEHWPWTSVTAARRMWAAGDDLAAIVNLDSLGAKSEAATAAGEQTNVTLYTRPAGERVARLLGELNERLALGLDQRAAQRERPGDDDGSFVNAGYEGAVMNIGSWPYAHRWYHDEGDQPHTLDLENVRRAVQLTLAGLLVVGDG